MLMVIKKSAGQEKKIPMTELRMRQKGQGGPGSGRERLTHHHPGFSDADGRAVGAADHSEPPPVPAGSFGAIYSNFSLKEKVTRGSLVSGVPDPPLPSPVWGWGRGPEGVFCQGRGGHPRPLL